MWQDTWEQQAFSCSNPNPIASWVSVGVRLCLLTNESSSQEKEPLGRGEKTAPSPTLPDTADKEVTVT